MTDAEAHILSKHRAGHVITPDDTCATIQTREGLANYRLGLKQRGALTGDALAAIENRRKQLGVRN